jgi:hypothetical protein
MQKVDDGNPRDYGGVKRFRRFAAATTLVARRPWSHSRKSYSEATYRQTTEERQPPGDSDCPSLRNAMLGLAVLKN